MRSLILIPLLAAITANAQQVGQNTAPNGGPATYTMSVKSTLVIETVTVKDKKGASIDGLTAKDFTITEDGAPQTIKIFEHQVLPQNPPLAKPDGPEVLKIYKRLSRTQITPEPEGTHRYTNRRLIALYFDMAGMRPPDQIRALHRGRFLGEPMLLSRGKHRPGEAQAPVAVACPAPGRQWATAKPRRTPGTNMQRGRGWCGPDR